ncbi:dihydrodipicolinate reductase [Babesia caballi]|uniref:Dihydrodipicolinate reductase n=1 Tax=Babesia caballi TaxID=5871 RepID=A0AAV4M0V1_BABCB|nr:dihydrodipicolinate reductase [Babesia caballi]
MVVLPTELCNGAVEVLGGEPERGLVELVGEPGDEVGIQAVREDPHARDDAVGEVEAELDGAEVEAGAQGLVLQHAVAVDPLLVLGPDGRWGACTYNELVVALDEVVFGAVGRGLVDQFHLAVLRAVEG